VRERARIPAKTFDSAWHAKLVLDLDWEQGECGRHSRVDGDGVYELLRLKAWWLDARLRLAGRTRRPSLHNLGQPKAAVPT